MFAKVGTPLAIAIVAGFVVLLLFLAVFLWMSRRPPVEAEAPVLEESRLVCPDALQPPNRAGV